MAETPESPAASEQSKGPTFETITPTQHVGPTLEAEGNFTDVLGDALPVGESSTKRVRPDQSGVDTADIRTLTEDQAFVEGGEQDDDLEQESGSVDLPPSLRSVPTSERETEVPDSYASPLAEVPEALKTRLPGDTSSDPHTDLGHDNATTATSTTEEEIVPA